MLSQPNTDEEGESVPIVHLQPQPLPSDVANRIQQLFPHKPAAVWRRLRQLRFEDSQYYSDRIIRCIIFCAWQHPDIDLELWIRTDYRDLIMAAEYNRARQQLRDFNRAFSDNDFLAKEPNA